MDALRQIETLSSRPQNVVRRNGPVAASTAGNISIQLNPKKVSAKESGKITRPSHSLLSGVP